MFCWACLSKGVFYNGQFLNCLTLLVTGEADIAPVSENLVVDTLWSKVRNDISWPKYVLGPC